MAENKAYKVQLTDKSSNQYTPLTSVQSLYKINTDGKRVKTNIITDISVNYLVDTTNKPDDPWVIIGISSKPDNENNNLLTYKADMQSLANLFDSSVPKTKLGKIITETYTTVLNNSVFFLHSHVTPQDSSYSWKSSDPLHYISGKYSDGQVIGVIELTSDTSYIWEGNVIKDKVGGLNYPVLSSIIPDSGNSNNGSPIYNLVIGIPDVSYIPRIKLYNEKYTENNISLDSSYTVAYLNDITNYIAISPITISNNRIGLRYNITKGLGKDDRDNLYVKLKEPSGGLTFGADNSPEGISVKLKPSGGLKCTSDGLEISTGNGLQILNNNNSLDIKLQNNSAGLELTNNGLGIKLDDPSSGLIKNSDGLKVKVKGGDNILRLDPEGLYVSSTAGGITTPQELSNILDVSNGLLKTTDSDKLNIKINPAILEVSTNLSIDIKKDIRSTANITANAFYATSDKSLKENIQNIDGYDNIPEIVQFKWKSADKKSYGVIAQDLQEKYPELIAENPEGRLSVDYISTLCLTVKKLQNKIEALESRINYLENKLNNQ